MDLSIRNKQLANENNSNGDAPLDLQCKPVNSASVRMTKRRSLDETPSNVTQPPPPSHELDQTLKLNKRKPAVVKRIGIVSAPSPVDFSRNEYYDISPKKFRNQPIPTETIEATFAPALPQVQLDANSMALLMCLGNMGSTGGSSSQTPTSLIQSMILPQLLSQISNQAMAPSNVEKEIPKNPDNFLLQKMAESAEKLKQQIQQQVEEINKISRTIMTNASVPTPQPSVLEQLQAKIVQNQLRNNSAAAANLMVRVETAADAVEQPSTGHQTAPKSFGKSFIYPMKSMAEANDRLSKRQSSEDSKIDVETNSPVQCVAMHSIGSSSSPAPSSQTFDLASPSISSTSTCDASPAKSFKTSPRSGGMKLPTATLDDRRAFDIANRFRSGPLRLWMVAGDTLQLWQFLLQLLLDTPLYSQSPIENMADAVKPLRSDLPAPPIYWTGQGPWEFKIADAEMVARLWGLYKNCPRMNYAKLARGLRFYYGKSIVQKTPIAFVYRFYDDKVLSQPLDGSRLRLSYEALSGNTQANRVPSVLGLLDKRITIRELLESCRQVRSTTFEPMLVDLAGEDNNVHQNVNMRPTKLLADLVASLPVLNCQD